MEMSHESSPLVPAAAWTDWLPIAAVILPLGLADVAVCPLMKAIRPQDFLSVIVYSSFGMILAQGGLLTCGLVFVRGPFWLRLIVHWVIAAGLVSLWAIGFFNSLYSYNRDRVWHEIGWLVCSLPAISLGLQLPFWGAKCWLGWNWQPESANVAAQPAWRLSIFDLLVVTAVVAGTLAVARMAPTSGFLPGSSGQQLLSIGLFAAGAIGVSLLGLFPLVGIFQLRWPLAGRWGLALGIAFLLTSISLVIPASGLMGRGIEPQAIVGLFAVVFWYVVTVCGGLTFVEWRRWMEF